MSRLKGKVILVAGAGAIGGEVARRYAEEGASVILGDVDIGGATAWVDRIKAAGGQGLAIQLDGADETSINDAVAQCHAAYGGLDGAHLNFAVFEDNETDIGVMEHDMAVFDRIMQVNVRGFFLCTRAVLPALIARGGGSLLYTSSIAAYIGGARRIAYAMSKTAILALMRHVATRHGPDGVRANAIAPGFIERPDQPEVFTPEIIAGAKCVQRLKSRIGRPDDIAGMSALLMSDDGAFVTGQSIAVDGGVTIRP